MKKTILYVITQGEWGGAQRYVYDLATGLAGNFDVIVAIGEPDSRKDLQNKFSIFNFQFSNKSQIQITQLQHLRCDISPWHDILAVFEIAKLYKTIKPDIIHLNSSKAGVIGSLAKLINSLFIIHYSLFLVYTVHGWVFNEPSRKLGRWLYRLLERMTARWKDKIIVLSDRDLADGIKSGIDEKKMVKIPLGIEQPQFLSREEAKEKIVKLLNCQIAVDDKIIGTIANLYKTKGLDVLIEAVNIIKNIKKILKNIKFIIIGEGPEREKLENLIKRYKLENIIYLLGAVDNATKYLKAFDLYVLPSRKEGMPYTILEAMAAQIPIIATKVGGVPEMIDKQENSLVESENPKQLAEKIVYLIDHLDEAKKKRPITAK